MNMVQQNLQRNRYCKLSFSLGAKNRDGIPIFKKNRDCIPIFDQSLRDSPVLFYGTSLNLLRCTMHNTETQTTTLSPYDGIFCYFHRFCSTIHSKREEKEGF